MASPSSTSTTSDAVSSHYTEPLDARANVFRNQGLSAAEMLLDPGLPQESSPPNSHQDNRNASNNSQSNSGPLSTTTSTSNHQGSPQDAKFLATTSASVQNSSQQALSPALTPQVASSVAQFNCQVAVAPSFPSCDNSVPASTAAAAQQKSSIQLPTTTTALPLQERYESVDSQGNKKFAIITENTDDANKNADDNHQKHQTTNTQPAPAHSPIAAHLIEGHNSLQCGSWHHMQQKTAHEMLLDPGYAMTPQVTAVSSAQTKSLHLTPLTPNINTNECDDNTKNNATNNNKNSSDNTKTLPAFPEQGEKKSTTDASSSPSSPAELKKTLSAEDIEKRTFVV